MRKPISQSMFNERRELPELVDVATGKYVNLRTTKDVVLLESILTSLQSHGPQYVLASWVSPPFNIIKGYGVYIHDKAHHLAQQSSAERWGYPRFGSIIDQERLEKRIEKLRGYGLPGVAFQS